MDLISSIIYLPSVRCNLNCKHCAEIQDIKQHDELEVCDVLSKIKNSFFVNYPCIEISGGEPFLNDSLGKGLIWGIHNTDFSFGITTNGYFLDKIQYVIENCPPDQQYRLSFAISVDGLETSHNEIRRNDRSFAKAVDTVRYLAGQNVSVAINIVMQDRNLSELDQIKDFFQKISPNIVCSYIPLAMDISEEKSERYSEEYLNSTYQYASDAINKKKLLSYGTFQVDHCHAGKKNIVIGPDGAVYACLTGAFYKSGQREAFCMGSLKTQTIDEILIDRKQREQISRVVSQCSGCTNPCEISREVNLWNMDADMTPEEISRYIKLEGRMLGDIWVDYMDWHPVERMGDAVWFWSRRRYARVYLAAPQKGRCKLEVEMGVLTEETYISIYINGIQNDTVKGSQHMKIEIDFTDCETDYCEIGFAVSNLYSPWELGINEDRRCLGICLRKAEAIL